MNVLCWWYRTKLAAHASAALPEALAERVASHVAHCPACEAELALHLRLASSLRAATPAAAEPNPYLWERLEAAMVAEPARPVPQSRPRLAPLAGVALAGMAVAAVITQRAPIAPPVVAPTPTVVAMAVAPTPAPSPSAPARPAAIAVAVRNAKQEGTLGTADPFRPRSPRTVVVPRAPRRPHLPEHSGFPVAGQAVALVEVGTRRVMEEAQTAALNRLVTETQTEESAQRGQHPGATATDATTLAQNTRSLFQ